MKGGIRKGLGIQGLGLTTWSTLLPSSVTLDKWLNLSGFHFSDLQTSQYLPHRTVGEWNWLIHIKCLDPEARLLGWWRHGEVDMNYQGLKTWTGALDWQYSMAFLRGLKIISSKSWTYSQQPCASLIPALPLPSSVILGKPLILSEPYFWEC